MTELRELHLRADLCTAAEQKFKEKFNNVEELLTFILTDLLRDDAVLADESEQRLVEERLRELGYL